MNFNMDVARPTKVWNLPDVAEWRDDFIEMINEIHQFDELRERLFDGNSPNDDNYADELNSILGKIYGYEFDFIELIGHKFWKRYAFIRAMHVSRPIEINDVLTKGLLPHSIDDYMIKAKSIFLNGDYPQLTAESVSLAVEQTIEEGCRRVNNVHFAITQYHKNNEDYAKYGNEFMRVVANNLGIRPKYEDNVGKSGFPTVFVCNVPIEDVYGPHIRGCLRIATFQVFKSSVTESVSLREKDICFSINRSLLPSNIVSYSPFP